MSILLIKIKKPTGKYILLYRALMVDQMSLSYFQINDVEIYNHFCALLLRSFDGDTGIWKVLSCFFFSYNLYGLTLRNRFVFIDFYI